MGHVCKEEGGIQITVSHISPISLGNQYQKYTTVEDVLVLKVVNVRKHHWATYTSFQGCCLKL